MTTAGTAGESRDAVGRTVLAAPAESIPLPDGSVEAVVATVVLCSVRSPERAVAEACRVLRPGGRFVFELRRRPGAIGPHIAGHAVR